MMDRYKDLEISSFHRLPVSELCPNGGIRIEWSCAGIGFGQCDIWWQDGTLIADTECMDSEFLAMLLQKLAGQILISD